MPRTNPTQLKQSETYLIVDSNDNPVDPNGLVFIGRRAAYGYMIKNWDAKTRREDGICIKSLEDFLAALSFERSPEVHH